MTGENAPVREVPGFARVGQAARRAFLGLTTPLFGTPGEPTKLGKAMDLVDEAASVGLMTYGASAARLGRAGRFAEMSRRGVRPETVLRRTGYQKGPFGYGVETRGDAYFRPATLFDGGEGVVGRLGDVADVHPDVATAYPGVERGVAVRLVPDSEWAARVAEARERISAWSRGETSKGFFDRSGMEVNVHGKMPSETLEMYMDRADKTLSHELQHAAHEMDGIPPPKRGDFEWYRTDAREVDARNSANRNLLTPEERVEMPRANTQDVRPSEVHLADRGGDSPHKNFHNFLATDDVPETLFGFPVVQREGDYTEADLKFFKENPKAAGFYDLGDEEMDEDVPQQAAKSKPSRGAYPGSLNNPGNVEKRKERRQGEVDSPHKRWAKFATPQDGLREMANAIRQIAAVKLAEKGQDFTIRNFAEVYAPRVNEKGEKENDTDKYIADISADSGFGPDEELHRFDEGDMAKLLKSVVRFESGAPHSAWFTNEEYAEAAKKLQEGAVD